MLFKRFAFSKWFILGFCAFLAYLGEGGGGGVGGNFPAPGGGGGRGAGGGPTKQDVIDWINANLSWLILAAIGVFLLMVTIGLLVAWLRARGRFMLIDCIVMDRAAVVEPWKEFAREANSFFWFSVVFGLIQTVLLLTPIGICVAIAWPDIQNQQFTSASTTAIIVAALTFLPLSIIFAIITFLINNFMVPVMYLQRVKAMQAARIGWNDLVRPNPGPVFLYLLMRIVVVLGIAVTTQIATCLTCCIAGLPYIGRVILLPLYVFDQSYTLYFIEQFGPQWRVFVHDEGRCPVCGYDVRHSQGSRCTECGAELPWRVVDLDQQPPVPPDE